MKAWQVEVLLGKVRQQHGCEKCGRKTIWHLTIVLDTKTNIKHLVWWCSICSEPFYEKVGPFVPN